LVGLIFIIIAFLACHDAAAVEKSVEKEKEKITKTIISEKTDEVGKKGETDASADEKENAGSSNLVM
jgi:hypothetical protein